MPGLEGGARLPLPLHLCRAQVRPRLRACVADLFALNCACVETFPTTA